MLCHGRIALSVLLWGGVAFAGAPGNPPPAKVPTLTAPLTVEFKTTKVTALMPDEAIAQVLAPAVKSSAPGLAPLAAFWKDKGRQPETRALLGGQNSDGEVLSLWPLGKLTLGGATWLLLRVQHDEPMASSVDLFALSTAADGAVTGGGLLGSWLSSEAGAIEDAVSLTADGTVTVKRKETHPVHDIEGVEQVDVSLTRTGKLGPGATVSLAEGTPQGVPGGRWQDPKSKELLTLVPDAKALRVFYAAKEEKPWQELQVDAPGKDGSVTVRFKNSKKPYVLTPGAGGALGCKNPDGSLQTFQRVW